MSYRGHIKDGAVILDETIDLPEGTEVEVEVVSPSRTSPATEREEQQGGQSLYESLKPLIGCLNDLPPDMSVNLDHYLYGAPKQQG